VLGHSDKRCTCLDADARFDPNRDWYSAEQKSKLTYLLMGWQHNLHLNSSSARSHNSTKLHKHQLCVLIVQRETAQLKTDIKALIVTTAKLVTSPVKWLASDCHIGHIMQRGPSQTANKIIPRLAFIFRTESQENHIIDNLKKMIAPVPQSRAHAEWDNEYPVHNLSPLVAIPIHDNSINSDGAVDLIWIV
jgi:hypothetical protein